MRRFRGFGSFLVGEGCEDRKMFRPFLLLLDFTSGGLLLLGFGGIGLVLVGTVIVFARLPALLAGLAFGLLPPTPNLASTASFTAERGARPRDVRKARHHSCLKMQALAIRSGTEFKTFVRIDCPLSPGLMLKKGVVRDGIARYIPQPRRRPTYGEQATGTAYTVGRGSAWLNVRRSTSRLRSLW